MDISMDLFRVSPKVTAAGEVTTLTLRGIFANSDLRNFSDGLVVEVVGADGLFQNGDLPGYTCWNGFQIDDRPMYEPIPFSGPDGSGAVKFDYFFRGEGENTFRIRQGEQVLGKVSVFSIRKEYLPLRPFRGDMHVHSGCSGCNQERLTDSPEFMAAAARAKGLDFISFSDHKQFAPGQRAVEFTRQCGGNFRVFCSEEVHQSDLHNIHMLNFGGTCGVSRQMLPGNEKYEKLLKHYLQIVPSFSDHWLRYLAANWHIAYDLVREAGGLAVFCHPFWYSFDRLFLPECIREYAFEKHLYDCVERFGGQDDDIAGAWYLQACISAGNLVPAVGNSDAHDCKKLGKKHSVIFAECNEVSALQQAVRENRCVAVSEMVPEAVRSSGQRLLVEYYYFLKREYYPRYEVLCRQESELMQLALDSGTPDRSFVSFVQENRQLQFAEETGLDAISYTPDHAAYSELAKKFTALEKEFFNNIL
jgi:hypothetical protein